MTAAQGKLLLVLSALIGTLLFFGLLVVGNSMVEDAKCAAYGQVTGRKISYTFLTGCMVDSPLGTVPREEIRQVIRVDQPAAK